MKIGTKITLGFGSITAITAVLGITAFVMFRNVDSEVTALGKYSLPAVQNSTGVERSAFECILEEKNYVIKADEQTHQRAKQKVADLMANLTKVDGVAEEFKDATLAAKSKEVRKISRQWAALYEQGVTAIQSTKTAADVLVEKGNIVGNEAEAYLASKQKEYIEAKTALATVNRINAAAFETRVNEKAYMLYKESRYFEAIDRNITSLLAAYDELEKMQPDAAELKQINDARKATKEYFDAAKKWVEFQKSTGAAETTMQKNYEAVMTAYNEFIAKKDQDYRKAVKDDVKTNAYEMLQAGSRVADYANAAVIFSKKYQIDAKPEYWKGVADSIDDLLKCYAELRKLAVEDADKRSIDAAERATQDYLTAAKAWVENDKQMKSAATTMDTGGDTVAQAAGAYLKSKSARTDKIAEAVFIVADISQTALQARLASRVYMAEKDAKAWEKMTTCITQLQSLYGDLRKVSVSADDNQRIDRAAKATADYFETAKSWQMSDNEVNKKILPEMNSIGDTVIATAQTAENDAWKDSTARSVSVQGIVSSSKTVSVVTLLIGVIVGIIVAFLITRSITGPLKKGVEFSMRIAKGDLTQKLDIHRNDEIGQLADSMNGMVEGLRNNMISISQNSQSLGASSEELSGVSSQVSTNAEETASQANVVSAAAEQVSKNINTVATGAEEMTASIREIAKNASEAAKVANHASTVAENTNATVAKLGDSSNEIGNVIKVITSIAEQTNLLALNATIEAARAGEAGKGFAVVANEVKELAKQTAKATEEIGAKIKSIQDDTQGAVTAIKEISGIIGQINQIQTVIASSVEEQAATTNEISRNVQEAAKGAAEIARNIGSVSQAAKGTTEGAGQTATAAHDLARLAGDLKRVVDQFKLDAESSTTHRPDVTESRSQQKAASVRKA